MTEDDFPDRTCARRDVARRLHPDIGGDAELFVAAMNAIDDRFGTPGLRSDRTDVQIRRTWRGAAQARMRSIRHRYRVTRSRSPVGRRRYVRI